MGEVPRTVDAPITITDRWTGPANYTEVMTGIMRWWEHPFPDMFSHRVPGRIADSEYDQRTPPGRQNPYWEIIRQLPLDTMGSSLPWRTRPEPSGYVLGRDRNEYLADRTQLCRTYSWSIPTPGDIDWITGRLEGRGIVEPGAGTGYWAWQLAQAGADVVAYDPMEPAANHFVAIDHTYHPVLRADQHITGRYPERAMLLSWPSYGGLWAEQALRAYRGSQLFYIGEGDGGCCADDGFFELLEAEWEETGSCPQHISWWGIHCWLTEYRRLQNRS